MGKDWGTWTLSIGTGVAVVVTGALLWGAGLFRPGGDFPNLENLEHIGSFIGGVFTPIAVGWAARTFLLQRQQMVDTLNQMRQQNDLQREVLEHAKQQFLSGRQSELENTDPKLQFLKNGGHSNDQYARFNFKIRNQGAGAHRVSISYFIRNIATNEEIVSVSPVDLQPFNAENVTPFSIILEGPAHRAIERGSIVKKGYEATIIVLAQRLDGLVSKYTFTSTDLIDVKLANTECAVPGLTMH